MCSSTSNLSKGNGTMAAFEQMRRGWRGGVIVPHRAFVRLHLTWRRVIESVALAIAGTGTWIALLPLVGRFWNVLFIFWGKHLGLKSDVLLTPLGWGAHIHFFLPCFGIAAGPAGGMRWWITAMVMVLAFLGSFMLGDEALPWAYLIRAFCLLQATALGYFAIASARFPHDLQGYTVSMLLFSCILIGLVPVMYAFTFYVLNFSLKQKCWLTLATIGHLVLLVPHQYLLHVYILHVSVLYMPVMYFVFGPFMDILAFVGFYSWGMSWKSHEEFQV